MFAIEWLRQGVLVDRETSALADLSDAVATTRARVDLVTARHPLAEPDGFRLLDRSGAVLITFKFLTKRRDRDIVGVG
jgi:hypothetical protein